MLTHASLFSGIEGFGIAAHWAGFKTVFLCEIDETTQANLRLRFPGVPLIGDIRNVTKETFTNAYRIGLLQKGIEKFPTKRRKQSQSDITGCNKTVTSNAQGRKDNQRERGDMDEKTRARESINPSVGIGNKYAPTNLTLLTAGVPCQPASVAGKRRGKDDDRWLWSEAIRVLSELKPTWAVFENPAGIGSLGEFGKVPQMGTAAAGEMGDWEAAELDRICGDIELHGYEVQPVLIPACAVGAPHPRERVFIIAHSKSSGYGGRAGEKCGVQERSLLPYEQKGDEIRNQTKGCVEPFTDITGRERLQGHQNDTERISREAREVSSGSSISDTNPESEGLEGELAARGTRSDGRITEYSWERDWIEVATELCGVHDGFPAELDGLKLTRAQHRKYRIKACGNALVPAHIYPTLKAIADIENSK